MQIDFDEVYTQYYSVVYRYLLSLTKDKHLAEDFTQETFYKALKSIDTYNPDMKMLSWLCTIAKNTYFTWAKRHKRQQTLSEIDEVHTDDIILKTYIFFIFIVTTSHFVSIIYERERGET